MKILLITGQLAKEVVAREARRVSKSGAHQVDVMALPVQVAALITSSYIARALSERKIGSKDYDLIIVPGLAIGSAEEITRATGVVAVKGPRQAADIHDVLAQAELGKLSPDKPADDVIELERFEKARKCLREIEDDLEASGRFYDVRGLKVPLSPPPIRVISEIPEAHTMSKEEVLEEATRLLELGADAISVGFEAGVPMPHVVSEVVKNLHDNLRAPIAIDSVIPSEVESGVKAGAEVVLSVSLSNLNEVHPYVRDKLCIAVPSDRHGSVPQSPRERAELLNSLVTKAKKLGIAKVLADPVLDAAVSPGFVRSLTAFYTFRSINRDVPLFMGVGNVTELLDADSVGVNALLAMVAIELSASMLLTVEKSSKSKGSTLECSLAAKMASLAYLRNSPPKSLGIDLLMSKSKRGAPESVAELRGAEVIEAGEPSFEEHERTELFKIWVNQRERVIEALYIGKLGAKLIRGRKAGAILNKIIGMQLISSLHHAAYLGRELEKAEIAMKLSKPYVQDEDLFQDKLCLLKKLSIRG